MLTVLCRLGLSDGREMTAKLEAKFPGVPYHITYEGVHGCLSEEPESGTPSDVELLFRMAALRPGATLDVIKFGAYEHRDTLIQRADSRVRAL